MKEKLLNPNHENEIETKRGGALFLAISLAAVIAFIILGYLKITEMKHVNLPDHDIKEHKEKILN